MGSNDAKILIVDDSRTNRIFLQKHLQKAGYNNISQACDGEEALQMLAISLPDLIILDIVMPKLNGFEVCRQLKQNLHTKMIPIIMVTGLDDYDSKLKCLQYGADDLLNKPVNPPELIARVNTLVHVKQYFDELQKLNKQLMDNFKTAERIQRALLPKNLPDLPGVCFDTFYQPTECVGGDYYNIFHVDEDHLCIYIADVCGHQFDGAMLTIFIKEFVSGYQKRLAENIQTFSPAQCLTELDDAFKKEDFPADLFISMFIAVYNHKTKLLTFSSAGFAQAPIIYSEECIRELEIQGKLIMTLDAEGDFVEDTTTLQDGEGLLLYTDGVIEESNDNGEAFGIERIKDVLHLTNNGENIKVIPTIIKQLALFTGKESFQDDIAIVNFMKTKS